MYKINKLVVVLFLTCIGVVSMVSLDLAEDDNEKFINWVKLAKILKESKDEAAHSKAESQFLTERASLVDKLIEIIDPENKNKYAEHARAIAARLIRELRAEEAISMLCTSLDDQPFKSVVFGVGDAWKLRDSFSRALIKIGRPAVPHLIKNLKESSNQEVLKESTRILLCIVNNKDSVLRIMKKIIKENPKLKQRLKEAKTMVEKWEEKKKPLY